MMNHEHEWELRDLDFEFFRELILSLAGITLSNEKRQLVQSRLRLHVYKLGFDNFTDYKKYLRSLPKNDLEYQTFINLLTTNKTDFFREIEHFDYLVKIFIPEWLKKNSNELKIWTCATSTGEEPYSLSMLLNYYLPKDKTYSIFATDIDTKVLHKAQNGVYPLSRLKEIPLNYHSNSISKGTGDVSKWFMVKDEIRNHIKFEQHNLIETGSIPKAHFDLIFCRNVFIYFNSNTIETVVNSLYQAAYKNSLLFIGHSESLNGLRTKWKAVAPSIYGKNE